MPDLAKLTVKNYRCFSDESPLELSLSTGFTAFVGSNNSGKSTALRLFYELRQTWQTLTSQSQDLLRILAAQPIALNPIDVPDRDELFFNGNDREVQLILSSFDETRSRVRAPKRVELRSKRTNTTLWFPKVDGVAQRPYHWGSEKNVALAKHDNGAIADQVDFDPFTDVTDAFANSMYIGSFRNAISQGASPYYDLQIGNAFVQHWDAWKTGTTRRQNLAAEAVTEDIRSVFGFSKLEINANPAKTALQVRIDGKPFDLREIGAGLAQFIVVFASVAMKRPSFILIDEPELNLHPSLQIDFLLRLSSYASLGTIFATHSIGLARSVAERIYSFQKDGARSVVRDYAATQNYAEFLGELSYTSYQTLGFEKILLVEGVTDVRTMQQLLRLYGLDHKVVILPLGGTALAKGGVEEELGEIKRITTKVFAVVDSERSAAGAPADAAREAFAASCNTLGFTVHLTERRATENYFSDRAVKAALGASAKALGEFDSLKALAGKGWPKTENWRIAREMTKDEIDATDLGKFLASMA